MNPEDFKKLLELLGFNDFTMKQLKTIRLVTKARIRKQQAREAQK